MPSPSSKITPLHAGTSIIMFLVDILITLGPPVEDVEELMVQDHTVNLYSTIPIAPLYLFREIVLVIDHNSCHLGQLVMVHKFLGIWP